MMFNMLNGSTLWVTVTNLALAAAAVGGLLVVLVAGIRDLLGRTGGRNGPGVAILRKLGVTLQDGGEPIDEMKDLRETGEKRKK